MTNTKNLKFTATHEWLDNSDAEVSIGITDHAQELLGDMVFVELPKIGKEVTKGDEIGVVESVKAASDVYAPISGVVTAVNLNVSENPSLVNSDPFGDGWLIKLKPTNTGEIESLLDEEQYQKIIAEDH